MSLDLRYFSSLSSLLLVTATVAIAQPSYGLGTISTDLEIGSTEVNFYAQSPPTASEEAETYFNRGLERYRQGDLEGAIADFNRAIELNPEFADAYNTRGNLRYSLEGDVAGAIADFTRAIDLNPNAPYHTYRGESYLTSGNIEAALIDSLKRFQRDAG
ncbi:MAG: tetratricopeptide repeat protein [Leptolyngbyaceae cyanobacterium RM2_2_4]|nr:tetratricopeptide repeat protein [Leptolyngbyaceae cyanobacterium RM2_2_4]